MDWLLFFEEIDNEMIKRVFSIQYSFGKAGLDDFESGPERGLWSNHL
jgi:hypothetical protein